MIIYSIIRALELWIIALPFTIVGILLASIAIEYRIFNRLSPLLKPILQRAHFSSGSGLAFITAFGSPIAATAMVAELYTEKKIDQNEVLLATVATWFPQTIYETVAHLSPIIPLLGIVGIIYICLFVSNGIIVAILMFIIGGKLLTEKNYEFVNNNEKIIFKTAIKNSAKSSISLLKRLMIIGLPISIVAITLIDLGIFDALPIYLGWLPLPPEALAIIPLQIANSMAAYVTLADLMRTGTLNFKSTLLTLLVANVFTSLRYLFGHRLPYYFGIFGTVVGMKIISVIATLRLGLTGLMIFTVIFFL
jgi:hypothetical protein